MPVSATPPWLLEQSETPRRLARVLVIDDVRIVRDRVCSLLLSHGYEAVAAESGEQAIELARCAAAERRPFAVAIVDILMPNAKVEGIAAARTLTHECRILCLMLTTVQEAAVRVAASMAGALGYLVKDVVTGDEVILCAVQAALAGQPVPDPLANLTIDETEAFAIYQRRKVVEEALGRLTTQQRRVADLMAKGLTNNEIAERLIVSVSTVNTHVQDVLARLGLASRREVQNHVIYDSIQDQQL